MCHGNYVYEKNKLRTQNGRYYWPSLLNLSILQVVYSFGIYRSIKYYDIPVNSETKYYIMCARRDFSPVVWVPDHRRRTWSQVEVQHVAFKQPVNFYNKVFSNSIVSTSVANIVYVLPMRARDLKSTIVRL